MRERLIEIFKQADEKAFEYIRENDHMDFIPTRDEIAGIYADHLLANGVIVPPCKVGDILYMPLGKILEYEVISWRMREEGLQLVTHSRTTGGLYHIWAACIGKTIFLTREEAEAAFKGR